MLSVRFSSAFPPHGLVAADTAAGIGEKTVVLAAAAVFVLPRDDDLLQRLKAEEAAALWETETERFALTRQESLEALPKRSRRLLQIL